MNFLDNVKNESSSKKKFFLMLIAITFLISLNQHSGLIQSINSMQSDLVNLTAKKTQNITKESGSQPTNKELGIIQQLGTPWGELFAHIEETITPDVAIMSISPDPAKLTITIEGLAKSNNSLTAFVKRINQINFFEETYIKKQVVDPNNSSMPLTYTINTRWKSQ